MSPEILSELNAHTAAAGRIRGPPKTLHLDANLMDIIAIIEMRCETGSAVISVQIVPRLDCS